MEQKYKIYHLKDNHNTQRFIDLIKKRRYYITKDLGSVVFNLNDFIIKGTCYSIYNKKTEYKEGVIHENILFVNRNFINCSFSKLDEIAIKFSII